MKYILINQIKVQNANAIAGFTWGFPAITHFLGFVHNLSRKLAQTDFEDICLSGCAVVCHDHQVHTYGTPNNVQFCQSRNPPYMYGLDSSKKSETAPVIEEGKMNMTVSLVIGCDGNIGNRETGFKDWLEKTCLLQRLAGGTVLSIENIDIFGEDTNSLRHIKFQLLPGYFLMDRSSKLETHYKRLQQSDSEAELLDAWLDFSALKQKARPKSDLIQKHFDAMKIDKSKSSQSEDLAVVWTKHLNEPYEKGTVPGELMDHFASIELGNKNAKLLNQWQAYIEPTEKTESDWEYIPKPDKGFLVPIMIGYKAISKVYKNEEVADTRDNETDVCFVEAVHSVGEWMSAHRLKKLADCLWCYHYEENWYLCKQGPVSATHTGVCESDDSSMANEEDYN